MNGLNGSLTLREVADFRANHPTAGSLSDQTIAFLIAAERNLNAVNPQISQRYGPSNPKELSLLQECHSFLACSSKLPPATIRTTDHQPD